MSECRDVGGSSWSSICPVDVESLFFSDGVWGSYKRQRPAQSVLVAEASIVLGLFAK